MSVVVSFTGAVTTAEMLYSVSPRVRQTVSSSIKLSATRD